MKQLAALVLLLATCLMPVIARADGGISDGTAPINPFPPAYPFIMCDQSARVPAATSGAILIAHATGKTTYICGYTISGTFTGTTAGSVNFAWGTGTVCGTSTVVASPQLSVNAAFTNTGPNELLAFGGAIGAVDQSPAVGTSDFCYITGGTVTVYAVVRYMQW